MTHPTTYASGLTWGEGPRWHDNALWVSDPQRGGLWTDADGEWTFTPLTAQSNGLWFLPNGRLAGAIMRENRVGLWDGAGFEHYADLSNVAVGPLGDMVGDRHGGLYVDDVGYAAHLGQEPKPGRIVYVAPAGGPHVVADNVAFPNGLALIDDGSTLIVAETWEQRLSAYTVAPDGGLMRRHVYADLHALLGPKAHPDGICAAADGGVWVCTLDGHCVALVKDGQVKQRLDTGTDSPVACTLDATRLFVTVAASGGRPVMQAVADNSVTTRVDVFDLLGGDRRSPASSGNEPVL